MSLATSSIAIRIGFIGKPLRQLLLAKVWVVPVYSLGLAFTLTLGTAVSAVAATDIQSAPIMLAQSETNDGVTNQPRIISRPQTLDSTNDTASTDSNDNNASTAGSQPSANPAPEASGVHVLPEWLPASWKKTLTTALDSQQLDFVARYFLWILVAVALVCLLPLFLLAIASDRKRNRFNAEEAAHVQQRLATNEPADFDDLDLTEALQIETADTQTPVSDHSQIAATGVAEIPNTDPVPDKSEPDYPLAGNADNTEMDKLLVEDDLNLFDDIRISDPQIDAGAAGSFSDQGNDDLHESTLALDELLPEESLAIQNPAVEVEGNARHLPDIHADHSKQAPPLTDTSTTHDSSALQPLTRFGLWLHELPQEEGSRAAMEAFLYWVRYGAGHVKPGLADALSNAEELDDHGRIKRAVLSFQPEILHDTLLSLKKHLARDQYMPFLDMMLAVLVTGSGIKPVENLLLRYYADFIGIGCEKLDFRYRKAHGKPLPNMPRPDRMKWWDEQAEFNSYQRADWALLGIDDSASAETLDRIRRLAEFRHAPERFSILGDRERSLIARNLEKYHAALDSAMEVAS